MMKTAKLFSALVLSVGFAACGGQELAENQTIDENGSVVESVEQALTSGYCSVQITTLNGNCGAYVSGVVIQRVLTAVCVPNTAPKGTVKTWPNGSKYDSGSPCSF